MSDYISSLYQKLRPSVLRDVRNGSGGIVTAGGGGGMVSHALYGIYHTGELDPSQAPWAVTQADLDEIDTHARQHDVFDAADHVANGAAGQIAGFTALNTWGKLTPSNGIGMSGTDLILLSTVGGAGITYTSGVLAVGAGTLITVNANDVALSNGSAQYQVPVTGATPFTPAYTALSTFAGAGIAFTGGQYAVGEGAGLTVTANDVALTTPGTLTVATTNAATGSHTHAITNSSAPTDAKILASDSGGGLTLQELRIGAASTFYSTNAVNTGPDIQFATNALIAAESSIYFNIDSNNDAAGSFVINKGSSTTDAVELVRVTNAGRMGIGDSGPSYELDVAGTARATVALRTADVIASVNVRTPSVDTASGALSLSPATGTVKIAAASATLSTDTGQALTIAPTGDLYLSPGGLDTIVDEDSAFRSDNFLKTILTAGFRIGPTSLAGQTGVVAGSGEFDELRARIFVADETRVDRGQWFLTKSYGILSRPFTNPVSVDDTAFLYVENSPHVAGALFANGDWIMLAYLSIDAGILLTKIWGQVASYNTTGLTGEQRWTFTKKSAGNSGLEFAKGALALDFGMSGQGYILMDTVTSTAPSIQVGRWVGANPYTPANYEVLTAMGRLDSVGFTGEYGVAASVDGYNELTDDAFIRVSTAGAILNNLPLVLTSGGDTKVYIGAWDDVWFGPSSSDKRLSWDGFDFTIEGTIIATDGEIANWDIGVINANTISSNNIKLISGAAAEARLEVGGAGDDFAGVLSRSTGAAIVFWAGKSYANVISNPTTVPFRVNLNGDLFASNADITGNVNAATGTIANWSIGTVDADTISSTNIRMVSGASAHIAVGDFTGANVAGLNRGDVATDTVFWGGQPRINRGGAPFRVTLGGDLYASEADITGNINAETGTIANWDIGVIDANTISNATNFIRLIAGGAGTARLEVGDGTTLGTGGGIVSRTSAGSVVFWAGDPLSGLDSNTPFRVTLAGALTATSANITGTVTATAGAIGGWTIAAAQISASQIKIVSGDAFTARIELGDGTAARTAGIRAGGAGAAGDPVFWAGSAHTAIGTDASFYVTLGGTLVSTAASFGTMLVDTTGAFIIAPSAFNLNYGYKFKLGGSGGSLGAGLTAIYAAGSRTDIQLWNNSSTETGVSPLYSGIDSALTIRNVAGGAGKNSKIDLQAAHSSAGTTTQIQLTNNGTTQEIRMTGTAYVNNNIVYHAGNLPDALTGYATDAELSSAVALLAPKASPTFTGTATLSTLTKFTTRSSEPTLADGEGAIFVTYNGSVRRFVIAYNDGSLKRYRYLKLENADGTTATWNHDTVWNDVID